MSYLKIPNLYKDQDILAFKHVYALEKVHGTSAHIRYRKWPATYRDHGGTSVPTVDSPAGDIVDLFSGGAKHSAFAELFVPSALLEGFRRAFADTPAVDCTVYGEAYGGKMQGMSKTYGPDLKFIAFEVKIDGLWLSVPQAEEFVVGLGLTFVPYMYIGSDLGSIDAARDKMSVVAMMNGMGPDHIAEGVVLRPPFEVTRNNGTRVIAKHKRAEFSETRTERKVAEPASLDVLDTAKDYCTPERVAHVIDKFQAMGHKVEIESTADFIHNFHADVAAEATDADRPKVFERAAVKYIHAYAAKAFKKLATLVPHEG